jgi:hypothetical protein
MGEVVRITLKNIRSASSCFRSVKLVGSTRLFPYPIGSFSSGFNVAASRGASSFRYLKNGTSGVLKVDECQASKYGDGDQYHQGESMYGRTYQSSLHRHQYEEHRRRDHHKSRSQSSGRTLLRFHRRRSFWERR